MDAFTDLESIETASVDLCVEPSVRSASPAELRRWLRAPEGARLEFKEAKHGFNFEKLVQYVVALANERGGKIILGVTDKRPRIVTGTAAFAEPGRLEAGLFERLQQRVPVEETVTSARQAVHVLQDPAEGRSGMAARKCARGPLKWGRMARFQALSSSRT